MLGRNTTIFGMDEKKVVSKPYRYARKLEEYFEYYLEDNGFKTL